jgi:hypothetical protein
VNGTRSPRNNRLLHPRLDPRQTRGPRCFYSTTRATINNLSKLASNLPPPSDKTPPYTADSFRARPHLLGSHHILASVRPACHACHARTLTSLRAAPELRTCISPAAAPLPRRTAPRFPQTPLITRRASQLHNGCSSDPVPQGARVAARWLLQIANGPQCVVTGDGAVGKVRSSRSQCRP